MIQVPLLTRRLRLVEMSNSIKNCGSFKLKGKLNQLARKACHVFSSAESNNGVIILLHRDDGMNHIG